MPKLKINWKPVSVANNNATEFVYTLDMMARPCFGENRKIVRLSDAYPLPSRPNLFMIYEPWIDQNQFDALKLAHKGWPPKGRKKWWQIRLCLVRKHNVGIGYIAEGPDPLDMTMLEARVPVLEHSQWNKKMAHTYTAAWPNPKE